MIELNRYKLVFEIHRAGKHPDQGSHGEAFFDALSEKEATQYAVKFFNGPLKDDGFDYPPLDLHPGDKVYGLALYKCLSLPKELIAPRLQAESALASARSRSQDVIAGYTGTGAIAGAPDK